MSNKMTRGEKASKEFQELYKKLVASGYKPQKALREVRQKMSVPNTYN
jgi:hypothetical protein